jgi:hypothetical protein
MNTRSALFAGAATLMTALNPAFAGQPVVLGAADLDSVTAAGNVNFNTQVTKNVNIFKTVNLNVNKFVTSQVNINGFLATAEASADAANNGGNNGLAEVDTFAQVTNSGAFAFAESLAALRNAAGGGTTP